MRVGVVCVEVLSACTCSCVIDAMSSEEQANTQDTTMQATATQGMSMQGMSMQGMSMQGMSMQGFRFDGVVASGETGSVQVERGELIAQIGSLTLRGGAMTGVRLRAEARRTDGTIAQVDYRIASVTAERPAYDPTQTGSTYLYELEQWVPDTSSWATACGPDADGRRVAIPVAAIWDGRADRIESSTLFTLGCTTGVIAKCYRWGYRPWLTGYGDAAELHWACTRLARADYCGDGVSHTFDGTLIEIWDVVSDPGPIQMHSVATPPGMKFEAGWTTAGAVCLDHERWKSKSGPGGLCPGSSLPKCKSPEQALEIDPSVRLFTESDKQQAHKGQG